MKRYLIISVLHLLIWLTTIISCFGPTQSYPVVQQILFISTRAGKTEVYTMDRDGSNQVNLTQHPDHDIEPQFSPNGFDFLFISNRDGNDDIYFAELEWYGGYTRYSIVNEMNVSNHHNYDGQPQFSPKGSSIVFESTRDGTYEIYLFDIGGSNLINISNHIANDRDPQFSPDGEYIVFVSDRDGDDEIFIVDIYGTNPVNITNNTKPERRPRYSPTGEKIVFESARDGNYEIYSMDVDGSNQINLT
ncbi:uncharacterized protein METZ01_LOCUS248854, partial [marine metagenome]